MKIGTLVPKRVFNKEKMLASFYKALSQNVIIHHILTLQLKTPSVDTDVGAWCCVRDSQDSAAVTAADRLSSFYCLLLIVRCTARTAAALCRDSD